MTRFTYRNRKSGRFPSPLLRTRSAQHVQHPNFVVHIEPECRSRDFLCVGLHSGHPGTLQDPPPGELQEAVLEPWAGGRWYETTTEGAVCEWGRVLVWEPPARLVLAWQLNSEFEFEFEFDPELVTEVEVTFTELGPHRTLVELEHRDLERFGDDAAAMRESFGGDGGWSGLIRDFGAYARTAAGRH